VNTGSRLKATVNLSANGKKVGEGKLEKTVAAPCNGGVRRIGLAISA
jgi:hypothetical protein